MLRTTTSNESLGFCARIWRNLENLCDSSVDGRNNFAVSCSMPSGLTDKNKSKLSRQAHTCVGLPLGCVRSIKCIFANDQGAKTRHSCRTKLAAAQRRGQFRAPPVLCFAKLYANVRQRVAIFLLSTEICFRGKRRLFENEACVTFCDNILASTQAAAAMELKLAFVIVKLSFRCAFL